MHKGVYVAAAFSVVAVIAFNAFSGASKKAEDEQKRRALAAAQADAQRGNDALAREGFAAGTPATRAAATNPFGLSLAEATRKTSVILEEGYRIIDKQDPQTAEKAVQIFQEGIDSVDPNNALFYAGKARALLILSKPREALAAYERSHALNPKLVDAVSGAGWAKWQLHDFPGARAQWQAAVAMAPKSLDAWSGLAWVELSLGRRDEAIKGFMALLESPMADKRIDWKNGLTMARASNFDLAQIRSQFWVPEPAAFAVPATQK